MEIIEIVNKVLLLVGISLISCYLLGIIIAFGIPESISKSYYLLENLNLKWIFTIVMFISGMVLAVVGNNILDDSQYPLMGICGAGVAIVGAMAHFKNKKLVGFLHYFGAIVGLGSGIISLWYNLGLEFLTIIGVSLVGLIYFLNIPKRFFWIELIIVYLVIIGLFIIIF